MKLSNLIERKLVMRVFIAISLPEGLKDYLGERQRTLRKYGSRGNFSRRDNLHLTLRFIGEITDKELPEICQAMDDAGKEMSAFALQLGNWGYFPRRGKKILWAGLQGDLGKLKKLFHIQEDALASRGLPRETRELKAHITLGREIIIGEEWETIVKQVPLEPRELPVAALTLYESTRVNRVLTYRPLHTSPLVEK